MPVSPQYRASASHAALGPEFYDVVAAATFPNHILRYRNQRAAKTVGLDTLSDEEWTLHFGRFAPLRDSFKEPLALRYHGHQFRTYNPGQVRKLLRSVPALEHVATYDFRYDPDQPCEFGVDQEDTILILRRR